MRLTRKAHLRSSTAEAGVAPGLLPSPFLVSLFFRSANAFSGENRLANEGHVFRFGVDLACRPSRAATATAFAPALGPHG